MHLFPITRGGLLTNGVVYDFTKDGFTKLHIMSRGVTPLQAGTKSLFHKVK